MVLIKVVGRVGTYDALHDTDPKAITFLHWIRVLITYYFWIENAVFNQYFKINWILLI